MVDIEGRELWLDDWSRLLILARFLLIACVKNVFFLFSDPCDINESTSYATELVNYLAWNQAERPERRRALS